MYTVMVPLVRRGVASQPSRKSMNARSPLRDHYLPPDPEAYRRAEPETGRVIVIAPTRAACETIELASQLDVTTVLDREHGREIRDLARRGLGFGIVAGTGTGKTLSVRAIASEILKSPLKVGVVNREREATPETPSWNVVIVTTGIARRWFQDELIDSNDTLIVDEIHQTSAELELCLALGKRIGCRFIWLSATVDPSFYSDYLNSADVLETSVFDPAMAANVECCKERPTEFLDNRFLQRVIKEHRGVAVFLPTRTEVEQVAGEIGYQWGRLHTAFYHGGEPIRVIRPFLEGTAEKPFVLAMTQAGQSALNIKGLDTVVIYDACYSNVIDRGRNVLTRQYLGANEILQMAGRVHGRVPDGEVYLLTDRQIDFRALVPTPPDFQLGGDSERVALTAAAIGVDLSTLDLPVPLDRRAYADAVSRLTDRELIKEGRLTEYGRNVEALPVDREWGELLVHASRQLQPYLAVVANIDSLHRMTREDPDLRGLVIHGSDHLTGHNIFAEAVNERGYVGQVYGLPRHLFHEEVTDWAERRGVLVKALEDIALGAASVMRTLELPLPPKLSRVDKRAITDFQELVARVMPFDLAIEEETASGERVRLSRSSVCKPHSAVAGRLSYFADRFGVPRAAIEGTNIPFRLVQRYARRGDAAVEYRSGNRKTGLVVKRTTSYFGFELDSNRTWLSGTFPQELVDQARDTLAEALVAGVTSHPNQSRIRSTAKRLEEYWRRSGASLKQLDPGASAGRLRAQLEDVQSWEDFLETELELEVHDFISEEARKVLDRLPTSAHILGDTVPLSYEMEGRLSVVRLRIREGQARRLGESHLPALDRPLRFSVTRGRKEVLRADTLEELHRRLGLLPADRGRKPKRQRGSRRR
jgi:ATP-dependent helicase HrpA